jgi:guanylate kinase
MAEQELRAAGEFDYCLLNENLKQVVTALKGIMVSKMNI